MDVEQVFDDALQAERVPVVLMVDPAGVAEHDPVVLAARRHQRSAREEVGDREHRARAVVAVALREHLVRRRDHVDDLRHPVEAGAPFGPDDVVVVVPHDPHPAGRQAPRELHGLRLYVAPDVGDVEVLEDDLRARRRSASAPPARCTSRSGARGARARSAGVWRGSSSWDGRPRRMRRCSSSPPVSPEGRTAPTLAPTLGAVRRAGQPASNSASLPLRSAAASASKPPSGSLADEDLGERHHAGALDERRASVGVA